MPEVADKVVVFEYDEIIDETTKQKVKVPVVKIKT